MANGPVWGFCLLGLKGEPAPIDIDIDIADLLARQTSAAKFHVVCLWLRSDLLFQDELSKSSKFLAAKSRCRQATGPNPGLTKFVLRPAYRPTHRSVEMSLSTDITLSWKFGRTLTLCVRSVRKTRLLCLPISSISLTAILCHVPDVSMAVG